LIHASLVRSTAVTILGIKCERAIDWKEAMLETERWAASKACDVPVCFVMLASRNPDSSEDGREEERAFLFLLTRKLEGVDGRLGGCGDDRRSIFVSIIIRG
jgi:hypothetical protein